MAKMCENCLNLICPEYSPFVHCKKVSGATKYKIRKDRITEEQFVKYLGVYDNGDLDERDNDCPHWTSDCEVIE